MKTGQFSHQCFESCMSSLDYQIRQHIPKDEGPGRTTRPQNSQNLYFLLSKVLKSLVFAGCLSHGWTTKAVPHKGGAAVWDSGSKQKKEKAHLMDINKKLDIMIPIHFC